MSRLDTPGMAIEEQGFQGAESRLPWQL